MMGSMAAVTQSDEVRRLVSSSGRAGKKVMHVCFAGPARSSAFDAFVTVAPQYGSANINPVRRPSAGE
jgi:hypothetical protein